MQLAKANEARLLLSLIICRPVMLHREPLSEADSSLIDALVERSLQEGHRYLDKLLARYAAECPQLETRLRVGSSPAVSLHDLVDEERADLVVLTAHGASSDARHIYGSTASAFILYGKTPLLIVQDMVQDEARSLLDTAVERRRRMP
jgi:nucleotide-binding universal stress UspA family protein